MRVRPARSTASSRVPRRLRVVVTTASAGALALLALPTQAQAQPWGTTGADYSGGIVCQLPGGVTVPMARWTVGGQAAFSTADVEGRDGQYGPAPVTSGVGSRIAPGQAGISASDVGALAYLIAHHGTSGNGTPAEVAETSAVIAGLTGHGSEQQQCLGQQGTSSDDADTLLADARRYGGPYTVSVGAPGQPVSALRVPVSATVRSATGVGTPGVQVTFTAGADTTRATTDSNGVARTTLPAQRTPATALLATVSEPTTLTYFDTTPAALGPAPETAATGSGTLAAVKPEPKVSVRGGDELLLTGGQAHATATVSGTFGYSGTGTLSVAGPLAAPAGKSCSALSGNDFARAAQVWSAPFTFHGDGPIDTAASTALTTPGCYVAKASLTTTDSAPPVAAASPVTDASIFPVSGVRLTQSDAVAVAPAGGLRTVVTAQSPGQAEVRSSVVAVGPIPTIDGDCSKATGWATAPVAGTSDQVDLAESTSNGSTPPPGPTISVGATGSGSARSGGPSSGSSSSASGSSDSPSGAPSSRSDTDPAALSATVTAPRVERVGCYSLVSRSVITLDGRSVTVEGKAGTAGTTTLVAAPRISLANATYDGERGKAMTGTVTVFGAYKFAGRVTVGLIATKPPAGGCHPVTFADDQPAGTPTTTTTKGDGVYTFASPPPAHNLCYSVTARLRLDANPAVTAGSADATATTTFLAGVPLGDKGIKDAPGLADRSAVRSAVTLGITYFLLFAIALFIMIKAAMGRRASAQARS